MNCRETTDFLSDYLAGELAADVRETFEVHLGRCPDCRVFLEQFQTTITSAREETESDTAVVMPEELIRAVLESTRKR
jgi:predicted anti-sigma-YlaC factor YlaD